MNNLKLYLNENLSWRISKSLIEYGFDVISSHEAEMNSAEDEAQFEYAISEGRTVVTNNFSHFVELHEKYFKNLPQITSN